MEKLDIAKNTILLPNLNNTVYWIASSCIYLGNSNCSFCIRSINTGGLGAFSVFGSNDKLHDRSITSGTWNVK